MKLHAWPKFRWFSQSAALLFCGVVFGVAGLASQPAHARDAQTVIDPPGRVGRLSDLTGQVWLFSPDAGEWVTADRNRPLTTGDRLSTDASGRAEVRIGSTTLRLAAGTEVEVLRLDDDHIGLQLHSGSAAVRLRQREAADEFELRTPEGRFRTERTGRYRFDRSNDTSHVTVYSGQAHYEGAGSALTVASGQRAEFWVDARNAAQYSITEPQRDAFSSWNGDRDRSDDRSTSSRYVSPEMTGIEDLDRHGRWEQNTEYGALWTPRTVVPGWAPYAAGHWAFVRPWGWTWVDDAPWGFAPFHYGRWVWHRNAWGWAPGTYVARPVYAPALVGWVGGSQVSVSISIGSPAPTVGWFPLAPREVYVPSYPVSPRYVQNVNVTHVTHITNITTIINNPQAAVGRIDYRNRKFPHAVTVVPQSVLTARQPVAPAAAQWRDANRGHDEREDRGRSDRRDRRDRVDPRQVTAMTLAAAPVAAPVSVRREAQRSPESAAGNSGGAPNVPVSAATGPAPVVAVPAPPSRMNRPVLRAAEAASAPTLPGTVVAPHSPDERQGRDRREDRRQVPVEGRTAPPGAALAPPVAPAPARVAPSLPPVQPPTAVVPGRTLPIVAVPKAQPAGPTAVPPVITTLPARVARPPVLTAPGTDIQVGRPGRSAPSDDGFNAGVQRPVPPVPPRVVAPVPPRAVAPPQPVTAAPTVPPPVPRAEPVAAQRRADGQRPPIREGEPGREAQAGEPRKPHPQERRGDPRERIQVN